MKRTLPIESPRNMEERVKSTLDDRDQKSIVRLLKDSGIASYEPRVVSLLVHRMRRYVSEVVTDARAYTDHAGRADISMKDVRLASRKRQDALTPGLLTREDVIQQAEEVNQIPLPVIPDEFGVRLPPPDQQNTLPNLKWEVDEIGAFSSETIPKKSEGAGSGRSHGGGNRNKKLKTLEKFKSRNPFALKEKTRQEEISRVKAEAKARRRLLNAKRSS